MARTISFVKGKGSLRHNNRDFIAKNVDPERIPWNVTYVKEDLKETYDRIFGEAIAEYNAKQKRKDRLITNYLNDIKNSGNKEKQFYEVVVQIGKMTDTGVLNENGNLSEAAKVASEILDEYARSFQERNPNLILFNAVLHMDEATPHLHLDYIPVAHGYKNKMHTRNSLTKGLQEMGIAPATGQKDNETAHWQAREREYLTDLCRERGIEIEVLGVDRDSYTIPEYKEAMREKEAAEAEVEILHSEKAEIEASLEVIDSKIEIGQEEISKQQETLEEIKTRIADAEKKIQSKEKAMDKILAAGKPVEKEIKEIRAKTSDVPSIFGGEPMVKLPKKTYEAMVDRYRVAGIFENLNEQYEKEIFAKQSKIDKLTEKVKSLTTQVKQFKDFLTDKNLMVALEEFIRPKSLSEKLKLNQELVKVKDRSGTIKKERPIKHDIAI